MRVLVCGGRKWRPSAPIFDTLDRLRKETGFDLLIEGDALGVDRIAGAWAKRRRVDLRLFPADWDAHGKAAGPIRNQAMLDEGRPHLVIAFPGGRGTADMIRRAKAAGIEVREIGG